MARARCGREASCGGGKRTCAGRCPPFQRKLPADFGFTQIEQSCAEVDSRKGIQFAFTALTLANAKPDKVV
jgi:hypothetical protein